MEQVKRARRELGQPVGILVDLQGPRIRVGALAASRTLSDGQEVVLAPEEAAGPSEIPTTYRGLALDVHPGARILIDDGLLTAEVTRVEGERVRAVMLHGGVLKSNKGMNLPGVKVSAPTLTEKDRVDLEAALEHGADFVGVSFVRRAEDLDEVRALVPAEVGLVAKIEKAAALDDLPRIVDRADALMVARGDLGVELPFEKVPLTQKRIIAAASVETTPVITATQMLESMMHNPRPTRAEASDVANAILDGTDAVMLSAETAIGAYPVKAVEAMTRIIEELERSLLSEAPQRRRRSDARRGRATATEDAIAFATGIAAEMLHVPVIVCFTKSGFTARKVSTYRPMIPILGLSTETRTCRRLSLNWGVVPALAGEAPSYEAMLRVARERILEYGLADPGDRIAVTAGVPFEVPGTTNLLKIETV